MSQATQQFDRACGALAGIAIGDALGMPAQTLTRDEIYSHYGVISTFVAPFDGHPVSHGLDAAQVTDDTEQSFLLAKRLIEGKGKIDEMLWANDLLAWEEDVRVRGLRDLLGPSSKAALDAMLAGKPAAEAGKNGTTNGAAMRIAPVGIAVSLRPMPHFIDRVEQACRTTHNTGEAIAGATAVAAVISCGISGDSFDVAVRQALQAAESAQLRGFPVGERNMRGRIEAALALAENGMSEAELADKIGTSVSSYESVAAAFGIVRLANGDVWEAAQIAANIGDDTDTIGAIACAMAGACAGLRAIDPGILNTVRAANQLPIEATAKGLLELREHSAIVTREHAK